MGDNEKEGRNKRVMFLVAGAVGGAAVGWLLGSEILGSAVGMVLAVIAAAKYTEG